MTRGKLEKKTRERDDDGKGREKGKQMKEITRKEPDGYSGFGLFEAHVM